MPPSALTAARRTFRLLALHILLALAAVEARGQDVELLGEIYGTRPPDGYFEELRRNPDAFRFGTEGFDRLQAIRGRGFQPFGGGNGGGALVPSRSLGPRDNPVVGTFRVPVVMGLFADGPLAPPFPRVQVQQEFFTGPNSYFQTIPQLYSEMSGGLLTMEGTAFEWVQTGLTRQEATLDQSGLVSHPTLGIGTYIERILQTLDANGVDWGSFDSDGDGFVDVLAVFHPLPGAECAGGTTNRIWSHRWNLREATQDRLNPGFQTSAPRPGGGYYYVNDYTVQPLIDCNGTDINRIGVFAHELGHAFGLPDLYGTDGAPQRGAGNWDLMGTGGWGCNSTDASRPCHMGAWSKAMLGWVTIQDIPTGFAGSIQLEPVETSGRVLRIPARNGGPEYLLLESRQRIGFDVNLLEPGLLIWHIDDSVLAGNWASNSVNNDANRMGVWLRQADGKNQLASNDPSRGDRGDPYPGCIKDGLQEYLDPTIPCGVNRSFNVGTEPAAVTHLGDAFGVALSEIQLIGAEPYTVAFQVDRRGIGIPLAELLTPLLGGADTMTPALRIFLDQAGNQTGGYDLGDFRAFLQQNPDAVLDPGGMP